MLSHSLFESVFAGSPIGNYLLSPTPEATILAVNDAFLKAASRTREELVGVSLFEAFPGDPDDKGDTGEAALRRSIARVVASGEADHLPAQRYPIRVVLPDGDVRYEERFWSAVSTPILDADGRVVCVSHTTSDVTDHVRAAIALRESEKRFRALASATTDVVYRMSPDWGQMRQLEGRGFLKDTSDVRMFWLDEYIPAEDQARVHKAIDESIRARKTFELEHRVRRADGTCGWTLSRAVPMLDDAGSIYEWIGAASDVTLRKEAEEKLQEADRRKDEFLAMLAHELRNPLAPISSAAQLLQIGSMNAARVQETSRIIGRQVAHMKHLIDDLLDVSRVTRGLVKLQKTPLDIRSVLMNAVEQATPLIQAKRHRIDLHLPPEHTMVMGDASRLVQVVANILNNAAKYTHEGGRLALRAEVRPAHVEVTVCDDGIGMAPDMTARAFDLFTQAERTPDRSSGGLGLGLALVKSLTELHGGTVGCASDGIGKGSWFTVCLPLLPDEQAHAAPDEGTAAVRKDRVLKILVVDDNVDAAAMLAMLLDVSGHRVFVEHDAHRALDTARSAAPQVCLLDIGLPDMDGNVLAQRLRVLPETAGAVLVAVTGYGQDSDRARGIASGFDAYLVKPIDLHALDAILANVGAP